MAIDSCDPCTCIPGYISTTKFYQDMEIIACALLEAVTGGGGGELVVVTSVTPGTGALNLGKAEDAPANSGDVGVAALFKRTDTAAAQTDTDGDYTFVVTNSFGAVLNNVDATFQRSAATGILKLEDVASASGDAGVASLFKRTDTAAAQTDTTGDYTVPTANSFGAQWINIDSGFQATAATGILKLEDVAAGSGDAGVASLFKRTDTAAAQTDTTGDYTVPTANSFGAQWINIDSTFQATVATGILKLEDAVHSSGDAGVMLLARRADTASSSSTTDGDYSTINTDSTGHLYVNSTGGSASGATSVGNPVRIGATAHTAMPTAVTDGQSVDVITDKLGRLVFVAQQVRDLVVQGAVVTLTNTNETTIIAAGAAGVFHDITSIKLSNTSATAVRCDIRDATAGTVIDTFYLPAGDIRGVVYNVPFKQTTAANNWTAQLSGSVTDVRIVATAVKNI